MSDDNPTYRAIQAEVSDLRAVVCKLSGQSRQLFAVIFRDGGHRFSDLGEDYDRAFAGAEAEVLRLIHSNDELLETEKEAVRLRADLEDAEREIAEIGRGEFRQKPLATEAGGE